MQQTLRRTFASLAVRNFRLYFIGQAVSLSGNWMRAVALSWLVLQLTHSGTQLGLVAAAQFLPILLFGAFGGVIVDERDNKRLLTYTQTGLGIVSLIIGLLVVGHAAQLWAIYVLAAVTGLISVVDSPARQTFVVQMVGEEHLKNAVTLNATIVNVARIAGPSIAALLIATVGIGPCFIIDAGTFAAVLIVLAMMRRAELFPVERAAAKPGQLVAGLRYVAAQPVLRTILLMMVIVGTFTYEFAVTLPLLTTVTFHGNATTYSLLSIALGVGAIGGGLYSAGQPTVTMRRLLATAAVFGVAVMIMALMPNLVTLCVTLVITGVLSVLFITYSNATLQLTSHPEMRGRVMALWAMAFQGTTPIGGPLVGVVADYTSPRLAMIIGGLAAVAAAGVGRLTSRSTQPPVAGNSVQ